MAELGKRCILSFLFSPWFMVDHAFTSAILALSSTAIMKVHPGDTFPEKAPNGEDGDIY